LLPEPVHRQETTDRQQHAAAPLTVQADAPPQGTMINSRVQASAQANLDIPQFDGRDVDLWIQAVEMYFDAARTPLEQQTEVAISYMQGEAMQWWRDTNTVHLGIDSAAMWAIVSPSPLPVTMSERSAHCDKLQR
jgi:hypothetical protein